MNPQRIEKTLNQFNEIGRSKEGVSRLAFTKEERKVKNLFKELCENEGMNVRFDPCGNVIARKEGQNAELPPVIIGSHLDTVFNGGLFDGTVGVVLGVELIRNLNEQNIQPKWPIEVICFSGEESSRFGVATIGSKAMAGKLNIEAVTHLRDQDGVTFRNAVENTGLVFDKIKHASRKNENIRAFFEVHIEQGPVLESRRKNIGVVTAIAAPTRLKVTIKGKASHSGTTPIDYRKDALLGASEAALVVEKAARSQVEKGTVATVGEIRVYPGAMNVVPGRAEMKIDIRGTNVESKKVILARLMDCFSELRNRRKLDIEYQMLSDDTPIILDKRLVTSLSQTCEQLNIPYLQMMSGAGHDAMNMATICPAGLIFIPCKNGLSHHKDEYASIHDIALGAQVLKKEVLKWAVSDDDTQNWGDAI